MIFRDAPVLLSEGLYPFPTQTAKFYQIRQVVPAAVGLYGNPGDTLIITGNHQPTLVQLAKKNAFLLLALDSGGYSNQDAVSLRLLSPSQVEQGLIGHPDVSRIKKYLVPEELARAWHWKADHEFMGVPIQILPGEQSISLPDWISRLIVFMRVAVAQLILMFLPVYIVYPNGLSLMMIVLLTSALMLSMFWPILPGNGSLKGLAMGIISGVLSLIIIKLQVIPALSEMFSLGVFLINFWLGTVLMGAKAQSQ